jgi:hypothetical protein
MLKEVVNKPKELIKVGDSGVCCGAATGCLLVLVLAQLLLAAWP